MFPHDKLDWHVTRLEKRLDTTPDDAALRLEYARTALSRAWFHEGGEPWYNKALTQARRVMQHDPGACAALVLAGAALVGLERLEPAARYLDEALRIEPERADLRFALGAMHHVAGDRHLAVRELENACRLAPESWEPHWMLGRVLWERANEIGAPRRLLERSQYHTVRALDLGATGPLQAALRYHLGVTCLHTGRFADANKIFTTLLEDADYRSRAQYTLGLVNYQLGKYKNAVLFLRQHLKSTPEGAGTGAGAPASAKVHARLGMCYLQLGEVAKAREACNRALVLDPTDLQARWTLGCALLEEGREDEATRLFKAILDDAPNHRPAFDELVRIRASHRDTHWLRQALRAEVQVYDRLPSASAESPRAVTRERIQSVMRGLSGAEGAIGVILDAMPLTTDEGLRFLLWETALDHVSALRAREMAASLQEPGLHFGPETGREVLALAGALPEPLLVRGLQLGEEDLRRAAVDRHGPSTDVTAHRLNIDAERRKARAWQALLLLAIASKGNRGSRSLLVRWASEADPELAEAARAALAMLGDEQAAEELRKHAKARGASNLVEAMLSQVLPPRARFRPRPVSDDTSVVCSTCGRRSPEVGHLLVGGRASVCDVCMTEIARTRRSLATEDPDIHCALCDRNPLEARGLFVYRSVPVCSHCLDQSLGLSEREEIDRYLAD